MDVDALTATEQNVLVAVVRHLVLLDGELSDSELYDLIRLGYRIGREEFKSALAATEVIHEDREKTLAFADQATRPDARARIQTEVERIAGGDGLHITEQDFMTALWARWD